MILRRHGIHLQKICIFFFYGSFPWQKNLAHADFTKFICHHDSPQISMYGSVSLKCKHYVLGFPKWKVWQGTVQVAMPCRDLIWSSRNSSTDMNRCYFGPDTSLSNSILVTNTWKSKWNKSDFPKFGLY